LTRDPLLFWGTRWLHRRLTRRQILHRLHFVLHDPNLQQLARALSFFQKRIGCRNHRPRHSRHLPGIYPGVICRPERRSMQIEAYSFDGHRSSYESCHGSPLPFAPPVPMLTKVIRG